VKGRRPDQTKDASHTLNSNYAFINTMVKQLIQVEQSTVSRNGTSITLQGNLA